LEKFDFAFELAHSNNSNCSLLFGFINQFCEIVKVASKDIPLIPTLTPPTLTPPILIQPIGNVHPNYTIQPQEDKFRAYSTIRNIHD